MESLSFLIDQVKEENSRKDRLLPPQSKTFVTKHYIIYILEPEHKGKLTVILEMDEVLLYTFAPDEHEAYMSSPLR